MDTKAVETQMQALMSWFCKSAVTGLLQRSGCLASGCLDWTERPQNAGSMYDVSGHPCVCVCVCVWYMVVGGASSDF